FMTALALNLVIVALAKTMKIHISWLGWFTASVVPCLLLFILVPFVIYKMYPPEIKETPNAREWADKSLREMGPMKVSEKVMAGVFILTIILWMMSN
ncbi:anion permease, partial [Eggerthella lenta]|nr:anion permease [Eggerthella lenta]